MKKILSNFGHNIVLNHNFKESLYITDDSSSICNYHNEGTNTLSFLSTVHPFQMESPEVSTCTKLYSGKNITLTYRIRYAWIKQSAG